MQRHQRMSHINLQLFLCDNDLCSQLLSEYFSLSFDSNSSELMALFLVPSLLSSIEVMLFEFALLSDKVPIWSNIPSTSKTLANRNVFRTYVLHCCGFGFCNLLEKDHYFPNMSTLCSLNIQICALQ